MAQLVITHLSHDLQAKKSFVSYVWSDDPGKRLGLEVPFGTALDSVEPAAREAIADLSRELADATLVLPPA
jgi:hypothetical protein